MGRGGNPFGCPRFLLYLEDYSRVPVASPQERDKQVSKYNNTKKLKIMAQYEAGKIYEVEVIRTGEITRVKLTGGDPPRLREIEGKERTFIITDVRQIREVGDIFA